jgi:stringent starvation protein B
MSYVKDGEIVLNLSMEAVRNLQMGNEVITCGGRFGGVSQEIIVPITAVVGIFAKETGQGLVFQGQESTPTPPEGDARGKQSEGTPPGKSHLRVVK